ncbi:MAG: DNA starvation/stationary phase protection protein [Pseudomonadota bacterium]
MSQPALKVAQTEEQVKTGLDEDARKKVADYLSGILTDTYFLIMKTHTYHWNVAGPMFHSVHEMTEEQYTNMFDAADEIAERIRALGYRAPVSKAAGPDNAAVSTDDSAESAKEMIADLIKDHEATVRQMREAAEAAEQCDDFVSHDLMVERMTYHEKVLWMWRAMSTE